MTSRTRGIRAASAERRAPDLCLPFIRVLLCLSVRPHGLASKMCKAGRLTIGGSRLYKAPHPSPIPRVRTSALTAPFTAQPIQGTRHFPAHLSATLCRHFSRAVLSRATIRLSSHLRLSRVSLREAGASLHYSCSPSLSRKPLSFPRPLSANYLLKSFWQAGNIR